MGNFRPIPMKCFLAFIAQYGFKFDRISASHHIYSKRGALRPITIQGNEKMVPAFHLKTNCRTIGCTTKELYDWAEKNC